MQSAVIAVYLMNLYSLLHLLAFISQWGFGVLGLWLLLGCDNINIYSYIYIYIHIYIYTYIYIYIYIPFQ